MAGTILAGDVGGTKTHLGLYRANGPEPLLLRERVYATHDFASLEDAVADFLGGAGLAGAACFGVPGPVIDGVSHATNVPWNIAEGTLARALNGTRVRLMNDLEATAYGLLHLEETELAILQPGEARRGRANIAVIAAGTGLGEAGMVATADGYHAIATEGGHCDFAPRGPEQEQLLEFLAREFGHVSFERVLSGPGLHNIYRFLLAHSQGSEAKEPQWLVERMSSEDPAAVISEAALEGRDPQCVHALEMFAAIYGAESANLALKFLAMGGVYLGGGIAPKILPFLQRGGFVRAFLDKGRLRSTLERIAIRVSLNPAAALIGAAHVAASML
jgi:glucokinase